MRRSPTETTEDRSPRCADGESACTDEPPWMAGFGALRDISDESRRVLESIEEEFERLPPEDSV